ncbi:MAG: helix-turn-helix domain-containing protein [Ottowia sp.]|nr:helix-turn-helix domain-containing protein [Thauera sp.]MBP7454117.1 helix-turn-helix domain-containing protein [Ottowia sp.]
MTTREKAASGGDAVQARAHIDLAEMPANERLGCWVDEVCAASAEADCELSEPERLYGRLEHLHISDIAINHLRVSAQTFRRTRAHLSRARDDVFALVRVQSGQARVEQGERRIVLDAGDLAINSGLETGAMHLSEGADVLLTVIPAALMRSVTGTSHQRGTLRLGRDGHYAPLLSQFLQSLVDHADTLSSASASHLRNGLLSTIAAACTPGPTAEADDANRLAQYHRARVLEFMRQHLATPGLDLAAIAAGVGLSVSQIHRLFPSSSGSPMRTLWQLRLQRARQLLDTTHPPQLADVAWLCGYQTQAHFNHAFKRQFGAAPTVYLAQRITPRTQPRDS